MGERMARAEAALDIETGGGEVLATVARPPALLVATEGWWPNVGGAGRRLGPRGVRVVAVADAPVPPFVASSFDLVVSRHPAVVLWGEVAVSCARAGPTSRSTSARGPIASSPTS